MKQGPSGTRPSLDDVTDVETHSHLTGRGSQGLFGVTINALEVAFQHLPGKLFIKTNEQKTQEENLSDKTPRYLLIK